MWSLIGLILALAVAAAAWRRSRSPGGFYDRRTTEWIHRLTGDMGALSLAFRGILCRDVRARARDGRHRRTGAVCVDRRVLRHVVPAREPPMSEFRFSPRPNRAGEIAWMPWGAQAFERAQSEDKPILLAISAVWCHWCHVMDETSYSDSEVIDADQQAISFRFASITTAAPTSTRVTTWAAGRRPRFSRPTARR